MGGSPVGHLHNVVEESNSRLVRTNKCFKSIYWKTKPLKKSLKRSSEAINELDWPFLSVYETQRRKGDVNTVFRSYLNAYIG